MLSKLIVITIIKICKTPFPEVNQIKGALQKPKSGTHKKHNKKCQYIRCDFFIFAFYLPKRNQREINPHPGNRKGSEKRLQKTPTQKQARENRWRKYNKLKMD